MAQVDVRINGRPYRIACDDGEEGHVTELAAYVDRRVTELVAKLGQVGDARLLVMASLLIADELGEAYAALDAREQGGEGNGHGETELAATIETLAQRIESIAGRLGGP